MPAAQQAAPWVFYGSLGLIVLIPFLFRTTATFIVNMIGFIYPTFASIVTIQKKDDRKMGQWLVYWVVYAALLVVQRVFDSVLSKIPFYPLFNAILLIALMHYPFEGHDTLAQFLYYKYIAANFGKAAVEANEALIEAAGEMQRDPQAFAGALINGNENKLSTEIEKLIQYKHNCRLPPTENNDNFLSGNTALDPSSSTMVEMLQGMQESAENVAEERVKAAAEKAAKLAEEIAKEAGNAATEAQQAIDGAVDQAIQDRLNDSNINQVLSEGVANASGNSENDEENSQRFVALEEYPFACDQCPKRCISKRGLTSHLKNSHFTARINVYKRVCGPRNEEKLATSQEVLALTPSSDDIDVDVGENDSNVDSNVDGDDSVEGSRSGLGGSFEDKKEL